MSLSYSTEVFRAILIVFIGLSSVLEVHGQSDSTTSRIEWPDGGYDLKGFKSHTPYSITTYGLQESKERKGEFTFTIEDGLRYGWVDPNRTLFVVHEGQLFISGYQTRKVECFLKCFTKGTFIVYNLNTSNKSDDWLNFEPDSNDSIQPNFKLYVYSLRTGNSRLLTRAYIEARFADFPDLLSRFKEENPGTEEPVDEVKIKYINLLNERVGLN